LPKNVLNNRGSFILGFGGNNFTDNKPTAEKKLPREEVEYKISGKTCVVRPVFPADCKNKETLGEVLLRLLKNDVSNF